jgi:Ca-activated chloride channel family protein
MPTVFRTPGVFGKAFLVFTMLAALLVLAGAPPVLAQDLEEKVHLAPLDPLPSSQSQASGVAAPNLIKPLSVDVDLVLVPVSITDGMNRPVTGLEKQSFALYEDNVQQEIRFFSTEDAPISVGVILDLSKSMSNKVDDARQAVSEFFKTANPDDEYFVITFADRPKLLADSTRSIGFIQSRLAGAKPGGHTALLDAIYLGMAKLRQSTYSRRALVIISDGGDNRSRYTAREIKSLVQEGDVQIYGIGIFNNLFKTPEEWAGKRLLTEITQATGGRTLTLQNSKDLPKVAATVSLELRNQYVLGYHSKNVNRDRRWRRINVRLEQPPAIAHAQVSCKRGYLAAQ